MKKFTTTAIIMLAVGVALAIVGAIFQDITWSGTFTPVHLGQVFETIGFVAAALSGIILVGFGVALAITEQSKK